MKEYRSNLRAVRIARGMSQTDLANEIGVTRQTINRLEGDRANPTLDLVYKLSGALDIPIEQIFYPVNYSYFDRFIGRDLEPTDEELRPEVQ